MTIINSPCSIMPRLTRDRGPNMGKAAMDLNLNTHLQQLFRPMKTLLRKVLNIHLVIRPSMVAMDMNWLNIGFGVTNMGSFMSMFIMNKIC